MLFYNQSGENTRNKLAISFTSYVNNLTGTLQHIYSFLNIPLPDEVLSKATTLQSSTHNRTTRKSTYDPKYNWMYIHCLDFLFTQRRPCVTLLHCKLCFALQPSPINIMSFSISPHPRKSYRSRSAPVNWMWVAITCSEYVCMYMFACCLIVVLH